MTRSEVADEIESAIKRENNTRGGVILDMATAQTALDIIGGIRESEAQWMVEIDTEVICTRCGHYGKAGMRYCGYCGSKMTGVKTVNF